MARESCYSLFSHDEPWGLCTAAQTSPGNPLALRMNAPASVAPMPSIPSLPQQLFKPQNTPRKASTRNSSWQDHSAGTWNRFLLHTSVSSCLLKPHVLHSTGSGSLWLPHSHPLQSPLQSTHNSRDCSDLPISFFLLILSSNTNKVALRPNPLYYSKSRANSHWKTEGQGN